MEISIYFKAFFILILIISIIGVVAVFAKFIKNKKIFGNFVMNNDLKLEETLNIDYKRRLVLCKFKKKKYLILLSQQDILIDVITEE
ncbi:flagellar biosynthetic protein FliO [Candidatus Aquarickettsia rohweri]|uniref:Flagellar biosynthesis protein FliO n=1 Tax=Candidatus Aquarickettsia rohweri TaxID=2602574 RepID=A0A429XF99_9RICK|nr:flagellar biosynthetic protein FliO [Candidatus Aquarickettsia rohweri]RST63779.1 hypothetical protein EIC27_05205 [Candidatus Aquarickettsia rohweri]